MPKEPRVKLTFAQKQQVYEKLKEVCRKIGDGLCDYNTGWNDEKVAEVMGVKWTGVRSVRREMFGNTRPTPATPGSGLTGRMSIAERDIQDIMAFLTSKYPDWKRLL